MTDRQTDRQTAVILHGICDEHEYFEMDFPSPSNAHWLPWLQQKLLRSGILCQCLEMPSPYKPIYEEWKKTFEQLDHSNLSVVVGHSAGCGFFLKWLCENPGVELDKLVLVAPWIDPARRETPFLEFDFKTSALDKIKEVHLIISDDDMDSIITSTNEIMVAYPNIIRHNYTGMRHFCFSTTGETFEDLWDIINPLK